MGPTLVYKSFLIIFVLPFAFNAQCAENKEKIGNPEFYKTDLYTVTELDNGKKVIQSGNKNISILEDFSYYKRNQKRKLRLCSKLGFSFYNIPVDTTDHIYYFNESIATFLEGENLLPKAKKWLEDNNYKSQNLRGLFFFFPDKPLIRPKNGWTVFAHGKKWVKDKEKNEWVRKTRWLLGLHFRNTKKAVVTYGYNDHRSIIIHEYIHMCGYDSEYHDKKVFTKGHLRSTYK